jgi:hypothetical protein
LSDPALLRLADVEKLASEWGYRDPKDAIARWRRRGWLKARQVDGRHPLFAFLDVAAAERTARRARPGTARRDAARARALAEFGRRVPSTTRRPTTADAVNTGKGPRMTPLSLTRMSDRTIRGSGSDDGRP